MRPLPFLCLPRLLAAQSYVTALPRFNRIVHFSAKLSSVEIVLLVPFETETATVFRQKRGESHFDGDMRAVLQ